MDTGKVVLVTVVTSVLISIGTFFVLRAQLDGPNEGSSRAKVEDRVEVPALTGLRPEQARPLLESRGLLLNVAREREDEKVEAGLVLQQSPFEGSRVIKGTEVQVVLSTGRPSVDVPALARVPLSSVSALLSGAGLRLGQIQRQAQGEVPPDRVISSTPATGARVPRGSAVNLLVSGAEGAKVPSVLGQTVAQATSLLEKAGFTVGKKTFDYDEDRRGGVVIRQNPPPETAALRGSAVNLVVNESD